MALQEEIEQKSFNIMISTTKLSARTVLRAIKAALRLYQSKASQGKQSVRTLLRQNRGVSSVEISKTGIRGLERYAKKYGIDYAIRKDTSEVPPRYLVFFKAPDAQYFLFFKKTLWLSILLVAILLFYTLTKSDSFMLYFYWHIFVLFHCLGYIICLNNIKMNRKN